MSEVNRRVRGRGRWWVMSGVLLLVAAGGVGVGLYGHRDPPASPPATSAPPDAAGGAAAAAVGAASPLASRSTPVALRIPAIGVAASVSPLGLNPDGTVETPTNYAESGWFRLGPSPGQMGSAVILGHVDSHRGPAVFFRLRFLRAGDRVDVQLADGVIAHFAVRAVETYPKTQFPARMVYGRHGYSALQLVTCGGSFDSRTRSYRSNVVAFTALVGTTPAPASAVSPPPSTGRG
jgi:hypothetical protein